MNRIFHTCFLFVIVVLVNACDNSGPSADASEQLFISGELSYREKMRLPPGSQAKITLKTTSTSSAGAITTKVIALTDKQIPVPFKINAFRDQLNKQSQYMLTAELAGPDGTLLWSLEQPVIINLYSEHNDLGMLLLKRTDMASAVAPIQATFQCGVQIISLRFTDGSAELEIGADRYMLDQVRSGSGARYKSAEENILFWNKGNDAWLTINDSQLPDCHRLSHTSLLPFNAHGVDSQWSLNANETVIEMNVNQGHKLILFHAPDISQTENKLEIKASAAETDLQIMAEEKTCRDDKMTYPLIVQVKLNDKIYSGCGGNPHQWLTDKEWIVDDLNKAGIIDYSHISLRFRPDNRLTGMASCNQYSAAYAFTAGLEIKPAMATQKACAPALMDQEKRFLALLPHITGAMLDDTGALVLSSDDGKTITARH